MHGLVRDVLPMAERLRLHEKAAAAFVAVGDTNAAEAHDARERALLG